MRRPLLLTALCLGLVGCGSDQEAATNGAEVIPASAAAFVSIDTQADGSQWEQAEDLVGKFPDGEAAINELRGSFEEDTKVDWEDDLKPALGESIALVWLDLANEGENVVGLTQPEDEDEFRDAITKANASDDGGDDLVIGEHGDWLVLATTRARIERFKREASSEDSLADDEQFTDAMAELPDDALVTAFARGRNLIGLAGGLLQGTFGLGQVGAGERPEFVAAAVVAEDGGFRVDSTTRTEDESSDPPEVYESTLLADVPADAVGFLSARGGQNVERQLDQLPGEALAELERELGVKLRTITALFENEFALYVRPGTPMAEVTLLVAAEDEQAVLGAINILTRLLTREEPAQPCGEPETQGGVEVTCLQFEDFALRYAAFDGKVVITTGRQSIEEIRSGGPRLTDDEGFKGAREEAGLPEETAGFLWLDVADGLPLLLGLAEARDEDVPDELSRNLEPVSSVITWSDQDGRTSAAELFIAID